MSQESLSDLANENTCPIVTPSLTLELLSPHSALFLDAELSQKNNIKGSSSSSSSSPKCRRKYATTTPADLLNGMMGSGEPQDDANADASQQQRTGELANNRDNEHCQQHGGQGSNAKWVKEGQNQLRKVAEKQQQQHQDLDLNLNHSPDQNLNVSGLNDSGSRSPNANPNHNSVVLHETKNTSNKTLRALCLELDGKETDNGLLLIEPADHRPALGKEQENQEEEKEVVEEDEEEEDEDEEPMASSCAEKDTDSSEAQSHSERTAEGESEKSSGLLMPGKSGAPSDEDSSCMSLSQGSTANSTPDGETGKT